MRMLKSICAASLLSFAAISVASCSSNSNEDEIPADGLTRIRVTMNSLNTRLGYVDQADGLITSWTRNDAFRIIPDNGNESQVFTLAEGAGTPVGTFVGTAPEVGDGTYTVLFPSTLQSVEEFDTFSFAGQQQDGSSNVKGIAAYHTVKLAGTTPDYTAFSFANAIQSSVMVLSFKKLPDYVGSPTQITLTADENCLPTTNVTVSNEISLKLVNMTASPTLTAYLVLGANPGNAKLSAGKQLKINVTGTTGRCYKTFVMESDVVFAGGKRHVINISNWDLDDTPIDKDIIVTVPSFGDGVILDDSNTSTGGNTPSFGGGINIED